MTSPSISLIAGEPSPLVFPVLAYTPGTGRAVCRGARGQHHGEGCYGGSDSCTCPPVWLMVLSSILKASGCYTDPTATAPLQWSLHVPCLTSCASSEPPNSSTAHSVRPKLPYLAFGSHHHLAHSHHFPLDPPQPPLPPTPALSPSVPRVP